MPSLKLAASLEEASAEIARLTEKEATEARRADQFQHTNRRLEREVDDLSRQVQLLLKEVEEARGGVVTDGPPDSSVPPGSTADEVCRVRAHSHTAPQGANLSPRVAALWVAASQ